MARPTAVPGGRKGERGFCPGEKNIKSGVVKNKKHKKNEK